MTINLRTFCAILFAGWLLTALSAQATPYNFTDVARNDVTELPPTDNTTAIFVDPYTGKADSKPLPDNVIRLGDHLFGSTVTELALLTERLDGYGQLAFYYRLADGRTGVARAAPLPLGPLSAPSSFGLLGMGLVALSGLLLLRWLRDLLKRREHGQHRHG